MTELGSEVVYIEGVVLYGHCNPAKNLILTYPPFLVFKNLLKINRSKKSFKHKISAINPDLVYVNSSVLWPAAKAAKECGFKTILHVREQISNVGFLGIRKFHFRNALETSCDQMIVISKASKDQYKKKEAITIIYNAVDRSFIESNHEKDSKIFRILFLGGVLSHKGGLTLLEALKVVKSDIKNVHLDVLGNSTSPYLPTNSFVKRLARSILLKDNAKIFKDKVEDLQLTESVSLQGPQSNVHEWLDKADLLVFPATVDHFGRPIIEALCKNVPAVVSALPSNLEIEKIFDKANMIFTFENQDAASLSESILKAFGSRMHRNQSAQVQQLMEQYGFYADLQAEKIKEVIDDLI